MTNGCNFLKKETKDQTSCCNKHDRAYVDRTMTKFQADFELSKCFWNHGYKFLAVAAFIGTSTLGWFWWIKHRIRMKN